MTVSRRSIMKLVGSLPLAGNVATKALAEEIASPAISGALTAAGMAAAMPQGASLSAASAALGPAIGKQLEKLLDRTQQEYQALYQMRTDGFDPDISALRSCSRSFKVAKQFERDAERADFLAKARTMIWGY